MSLFVLHRCSCQEKKSILKWSLLRGKNWRGSKFRLYFSASEFAPTHMYWRSCFLFILLLVCQRCKAMEPNNMGKVQNYFWGLRISFLSLLNMCDSVWDPVTISTVWPRSCSIGWLVSTHDFHPGFWESNPTWTLTIHLSHMHIFGFLRFFLTHF